MTEDDRVAAGELALGVLEDDERAAALRRVLAEPDFAAEVTRWRRYLSGLAGRYPAVTPANGIEERVLARVEHDRRSVGGWRAAAIAASAVAAGLALMIAWPRPPVAPPAPARLLVAALAGERGKPFVALYDERASRVAVAGAPRAPVGHSAELWLIAPDKAPMPLGLLGGGARGDVAVPRAGRAAMAAGATLAVSIEPAGGSPTGSPTGPVIATGGLVTG